MKNIVLVGNPNSGKSTIFNLLTGLRQKVSNFPGVTVEKKSGVIVLNNGDRVNLIDLPGTYSLFPNSGEEKIVVDVLTNPKDVNYPDLLIYVADVTQLERHLLLALQLQQLGLPMIFVANMSDLASGEIDVSVLQKFLQVPVVLSNSSSKKDLNEIQNLISVYLHDEQRTREFIYQRPYPFSDLEKKSIEEVIKISKIENLYHAKLLLHHVDWIHIQDQQRATIRKIIGDDSFHNMNSQVKEVMYLYDQFLPVIKSVHSGKNIGEISTISKIDKIVTHRWMGPLIFFGIMLFLFQAIYAWATIPMDWIEGGFSSTSVWLAERMPDHFITSLFINGIIAGLGGVMVFIPQIAILFLLISLLEESGYMSRTVYMFDKIMKKFGMNGRSVVSLISSGACAIPAIMATRTIQNHKERLITILVSPLISCSARLPVYAILVGFVVPDVTVWGFLNAPGLVFMGLYLLGILAAIVSAYVFSKIIKGDNPSYLMLELPMYKKPNWNNVWLTTKDKVMSFIREAGKIIIIISIILWVLSSFGPPQKMKLAEQQANVFAESQDLNPDEANIVLSQYQLEASYAGHVGKWMEPAIRPLGFDWKIGIALLTSFAAREVFVGTMATIYSIGQNEEETTLREKMKKEKKRDGITPMYNMPTALSLLVFYVFALQCMSTIAVTKKETGTWKWPIIQFFFMGMLAYLGSWLVYSMLS